jgi:CBS domain-containing protein
VRLDRLGFENIYLYAEGKWDWFAYGLPMLGTRSELPQTKDVVRRDVPTCGLAETMGDAHQRAQEAGWEQCIVVAEGRVILGRLRRDAWNAPPATPAEDVMENGPTTVRPDELLAPLVERMQKRKVSSILVATPDGILIGVVERAEAEAYLAAHGTQGPAAPV